MSTPSRASRRQAPVLTVLFSIVFAAAGCSGGATGTEQPTFDFVIPAGASEQIASGEPLEILPDELVANLNETIQIVNEDDAAHLVGPWYLGPGETLRQRFTTPGVYEGACSVHPSGAFSITVNG